MSPTIEAWLASAVISVFFVLGAVVLRIMVAYGQRHETRKAARLKHQQSPVCGVQRQ